MTSPIYLALVMHNHQPVGQFDFVNEHAVRVAYGALFEGSFGNPPRMAAAIRA